MLTSWSYIDRTALPAVQDYARLETLVRAAGPAWTIIRMSTGLADALARDVVWARKSGELLAPATGAIVTPAALTDVAEATAVILTGTGHDGTVLEITGPDQVTWPDLADLAGVPFRAVDDDEFRRYAAGFGVPPGPVTDLLGLYADFRSPWASTPTSTLATLLDRIPVAGIEAVHRRVALFPA